MFNQENFWGNYIYKTMFCLVLEHLCCCFSKPSFAKNYYSDHNQILDSKIPVWSNENCFFQPKKYFSSWLYSLYTRHFVDIARSKYYSCAVCSWQCLHTATWLLYLDGKGHVLYLYRHIWRLKSKGVSRVYFCSQSCLGYVKISPLFWWI